MSPILFHIWGPLAIHAYGVCIALGVLLAFVFITHDSKLKKILSAHDLLQALQLIMLSGYLGGRIVFLLSEAQTFADYDLLFKFWEPGFSILGSIIGIIITISLYMSIKKISVLSFIDRIAIYAPLVQGFGRIGCFFAGCCYGISTNGWWGVMYKHPEHAAPLNVLIHPTQLYSAITLFIIFLLLYFIVQHHSKKNGLIVMTYLLLVSLERFLIDFVRSDRVFSNNPYFIALSIHQWIALGLCIGAIISIIVLLKQSKKTYGSV